MKTIIGEYNLWGYRILSADGQQQYYSAGNSQCDSQQSCDPGTPGAVPLSTLRSWCIAETRYEAKQRGAKYGGATRVPEGAPA